MQNSSAVTVFDVSPDVERAKFPLNEVSAFRALNTLLGIGINSDGYYDPNLKATKKLEACSLQDEKVVYDVVFHPLVAAIHLAFDKHRPLCLSPDMIWLLIAQGFANHINANSEQLRSQFVKHQGKLKLEVRRDDFIKGSAKNPWPEVFSEFSAKIREHIGETIHSLLMPEFSTTGLVEKAVTEIVLLESMQSYFDYEEQSFCGIPQIKLEGTLADWQTLLERTKKLSQFQLDWWIDPLVPVLEQFIHAVNGKPNQRFWQSMYKYEEVSGGDRITGWITLFFPYLKPSETEAVTLKNEYLPTLEEMLKNQLLFNASDFDEYDLSTIGGISTSDLPLGLSAAPFQWVYLDITTSEVTKYEMQFLGGFIGIKQDKKNLFLRPEIGWAIREANPDYVAKKTVYDENDIFSENQQHTCSWFNAFCRWLRIK